MSLWTFWLILASGLLIAEVLSQSLTCLYVALGALAAMVCALMGYGWLPTIITCVVATCLLYLVTFKARRRLLEKLHAGSRHAATGMDALIGRTGMVFGKDNPRVRIDGDVWQVRPANHDETFSDGDTVRVVSYDSIILKAVKI